jgi:hypothetical protein
MTTESKSLTPCEMSDRQFLGWNTQVRQQLVDDLFDVCRENGEILEELLDEYVYLLKDNPDRLDVLAAYVKEELGEDD